MNKLYLEKIKVLSTNSYVYEFVFEVDNVKNIYRGIDDTYDYPFRSLATELFNLIDNQLYSNKLFNLWKIKLFKDVSTEEGKIKKSSTDFNFLILKNDLSGNIILSVITQNGIELYNLKVKLADFEWMIQNLIGFNEQPYDKYNYYSIDKFFE